MAQIEPIGKSECGDCKSAVQVCVNGGGYAYYRCSECGFEGRHHWHTSSKKFITGKVKLHAVDMPTVAVKKPPIAEPPEPAAAPQIVARKAGESIAEWMDRKNGVNHAN